jgi:formylglycine-generating enzyme required for sulfatase activity
LELPTEAQWEYACRCGETTPFTWHERQRGDEICSGDCNFDGNFPWPRDGEGGMFLERTIRADGDDPELPVRANPWGLYQMHGNVLEWCQDWYADDYYRRSPEADPPGPLSGLYRVLRGGGWIDLGGHCRSGNRRWSVPSLRYWSRGFRLAAVLASPQGLGSQSSS